MLLTNHLEEMEGVNSISVMMGTPANKDIFKTGGLYTEELETATPNDMVIVADLDNADMIEKIVTAAQNYLDEQGKKNKGGATEERVKTWDKALELGEDTSVAIFSIPGTHAALEIEKAIEEGKHVFCFSDNVALEDEVRLKQLAHEKGLLLMGPDCGTGIINGVPIAFTNAVRRGKIGVIGASGTGIQEVTTIIHKLGAGVTHAIGTGGRDLKEAVDGVTFKDSIALLEQDPDVEVIVAISKPPAARGRGLTPSGDDFLLGWLLVQQLKQDNREINELIMQKAQSPDYTTDVSRHYLRQAATGCYSQALLNLAKALLETTNEQVMAHRIADIIAHGHSSGADTLAGIAATLIEMRRKK